MWVLAGKRGRLLVIVLNSLRIGQMDVVVWLLVHFFDGSWTFRKYVSQWWPPLLTRDVFLNLFNYPDNIHLLLPNLTGFVLSVAEIAKFHSMMMFARREKDCSCLFSKGSFHVACATYSEYGRNLLGISVASIGIPGCSTLSMTGSFAIVRFPFCNAYLEPTIDLHRFCKNASRNICLSNNITKHFFLWCT